MEEEVLCKINQLIMEKTGKSIEDLEYAPLPEEDHRYNTQRFGRAEDILTPRQANEKIQKFLSLKF